MTRRQIFSLQIFLLVTNALKRIHLILLYSVPFYRKIIFIVWYISTLILLILIDSSLKKNRTFYVKNSLYNFFYL